MTKAEVLRRLSRVVDGHNGKTSEMVRNLKTCPEFQQSCQILAKALERNRYGRKAWNVKPPAGLVPPG
jgi:hypothetical protein